MVLLLYASFILTSFNCLFHRYFPVFKGFQNLFFLNGPVIHPCFVSELLDYCVQLGAHCGIGDASSFPPL